MKFEPVRQRVDARRRHWGVLQGDPAREWPVLRSGDLVEVHSPRGVELRYVDGCVRLGHVTIVHFQALFSKVQ